MTFTEDSQSKRISKKSATPMNIGIAGCGRYGALLANRLSSLGHSVVIIDRQENAFKALSTEFSRFTITGNAA